MLFYDSKILIPIPLVNELPVTIDFYKFNYTPKIKQISHDSKYNVHNPGCC